MESLPSLYHSQHLHLPINHRHSSPFSSISFLSLPPPRSPSSSSSPFRLSPIRASHSPNTNPSFHKPKSALIQRLLQTLNPFFSPVLKTTCIAAALFLMRLHVNPHALAATHPPPPVAAAADSTLENLPFERKNNSVEVLQSVVETKINEQKIGEAIWAVNRLIKLEPEELEWMLLKAHLCARNGDYGSARDSFGKILKREPFHVEALQGLLMSTYELKEPTKDLLPWFEAAVRFFEREKKVSEMRDVKLLIAQVKVLEGDLLGALKVYEELTQQESKDFRPYLCQGVVYTMLKKNDEAKRQFEKFRGLIPDDHPYKEHFEENTEDLLHKPEIEGKAPLGKR